MIRGFWTARTGLIAHQERLNTTANNMANVSTAGFKPMRTAFKDLMYQNLNRPQAQSTAMNGAGVKVNSNDLILRQGAPQPTGRAMDLCLLGDGDFFMVEAPTGEALYTRAGNFYTRLEDDAAYLVDGNGYRVLGADEQEIELELGDDGMYAFDPAAVGVFRFPNAYGLYAMAGNTYAETEASGVPEAVDNPEVKQGYLEMSAAEVSAEMVGVIEASKAFSLSARMTQVADEVEQTVNSLR